MSTHATLTEPSLSYRVVTHDRKGMEGKGVWKGRDVGTARIVSTGSASTIVRGRLVPGNACTEITSGCDCPPCPGRGIDGHGLTHCAECCFGSGVEADIDCPIHGERLS